MTGIDRRMLLGAAPQPRQVADGTDDVDRRGNIFITDNNQGLWILRYTGARP